MSDGDSDPRSGRETELLFDSADAPVPLTRRSRDVTIRHLLYKSGRHYLDLRIERERGSVRSHLVGQIGDADEPDKSLPGLAVELSFAGNRLVRTTSNEQGEFQTEFEHEHYPTTLTVALGADRLLAIDLDRRMTKRAQQATHATS